MSLGAGFFVGATLDGFELAILYQMFQLAVHKDNSYLKRRVARDYSVMFCRECSMSNTVHSIHGRLEMDVCGSM